MKHRLSFILVVALIAACGNSNSADTSGANPGPRVAVAAPSTTIDRNDPPEPSDITVHGPFQYMEAIDSWHEPLVDEYVPGGDGPWPVMAMYHGDPRAEGRDGMEDLAEVIAKSGML